MSATAPRAVLGFVGVAVLLSTPTGAQEVTFSTTTLSDSLIVLHGAPGGNVLILTGAEGALLVDAQSQSVADSLVESISAITTAPVRIVVNTHYHEDHIGGNSTFRERGAVTMGHTGLRPRAVVDTTIDELEWHREPASPDDLPMVEVEAETTIRFNGEEVVLLPFNAAHTSGDLAVSFKEHNVIHTGDIVEVDAYPFIDWWGGGSLDGTIAAVQTLLDAGDEETRFVPGHGQVVDADHLRQYRTMLIAVRAGVTDAIARGQDLQETMELGISALWDEERGGERAGRRLVGIVYLGLSNGMR